LLPELYFNNKNGPAACRVVFEEEKEKRSHIRLLANNMIAPVSEPQMNFERSF
jgi:hypothetical protein